MVKNLRGIIFISLILSCAPKGKWNTIVEVVKPKTNLAIKIKELGLNLQYIPEGKFNLSLLPLEKKQLTQTIIISYPFWMDRYEMTNRVYNEVLKLKKRPNVDDSLPVDLVSWDEALKFCQELNKHFSSYIPTGYEFRLPTEIEWEYACRAGTKSDFNVPGESIEFAWTSKNSKMRLYRPGLLKPNLWGLYDMHGNVGEWCIDSFSQYYEPKQIKNPYYLTDSHFLKSTRGGSSMASINKASSHSRFGWYKFTTAPCYGFRIVIAPKIILK